MRIDANLPLATIAAEFPSTRNIFETFGIDYACGGSRSLIDAAHEHGIDLELLVASIGRIASGQATTLPWHEKPLRDLVHHLNEEHHRFVRDELAVISFRMFDLCAPPARPIEDLQSLRAALARLSETLIRHLHTEEDEVFPTIDALEASWQAKRSAINEGLRLQIRNIVTEHGAISAQLRTVRELRLRIEASNEMPANCHGFLESIAKLEAHLHEYMFLENCILFPRAVALQEQITAA